MTTFPLLSVSRILTVSLALETLDDEPEWQHQLKEEAGDRERRESGDEADADPKNLSDAACHEARVANHARNRQPSWDQPGPEQQRTQEEARCLPVRVRARRQACRFRRATARAGLFSQSPRVPRRA